jgi:broad specificity phosphatase PhoE
MRHAATEATEDLRGTGNYEDCAWQRNLSNAGRTQAREIGASVLKLQLPIDAVIASPMCRTMETAMLVFGRAKPEPILRGVKGVDAVHELISQPSPRGKLTVIVGHVNPDLAIKPTLKETEAAILRPMGHGNFMELGRIRPNDWLQWANQRR